jgi:serine/threonine protein kinase
LTTHKSAAIPASLKNGWVFEKTLSCKGDKRALLIRRVGSGERAVLKLGFRDWREAVRREAACLDSLNGEGAPRLIASGETGHDDALGPCSWLVRAYAPGTPLSLYGEESSFGWREAAVICADAAHLVSALHRRNPPLVHRDVKPGNFIIGADKRLTMIDMEGVQEYDPRKAMDTMLIFSRGSAAPEQYGFRRSDPRADVYGLGKLLVLMLTGSADAARLRRVKAPLALKHIIKKCLRFDPDRRYDDAGQVESALRGAVNASRAAPFAAAAACLIIIAALAFSIGINHFGLPGSEPDIAAVSGVSAKYAAFAEPLIERAAALQLNKEPGTLTAEDLLRVERLLLVGDTPYSQWHEVNSESQRRNDGVRHFSDFGLSWSAGTVSNLDDLMMMPNLAELSLRDQNISDITQLSGLKLQRLALSGNPLTDLAPLSGITPLRDLDISWTQVSNLSPLSLLPSLNNLMLHGSLVADIGSLEPARVEFLGLAALPGEMDSTALARQDKLIGLTIDLYSREQAETVLALSGLKYLTVRNWQYPDLTPLARLSSLINLMIFGNQPLSLDGAAELASLDRLQVMQHPDPISLKPLAGNQTIRVLQFWNTPIKDAEILASLPNLQELRAEPGDKRLLPELPDVNVF